MNVTKRVLTFASIAALVVLALSLGAASVPAQGPVYSVWLVRTSVFKDVPAGAFMPDRVFVPGSTDPMNNQVFFQLPVNVGVIKGGKDVILYDTGWKQRDYLKMTNSVNWVALPELLSKLGIQASDVTKIVIGHGHWDHAGSLMDFPNAVLYVQKAELEGIQWALNYPGPTSRPSIRPREAARARRRAAIRRSRSRRSTARSSAARPSSSME